MKINEEIKELYLREKTDRTKWWIWCEFWNYFQIICFIFTNIKVSHDFMINPAKNTRIIVPSLKVHENFLQSHNLKFWIHVPAYLPEESKV